jgi:competence protein ComEC
VFAVAALALLAAQVDGPVEPLSTWQARELAGTGARGRIERLGQRTARLHCTDPGGGRIDLRFEGPGPPDGSHVQLLPPLRVRLPARGPVLVERSGPQWLVEADQLVVERAGSRGLLEGARRGFVERLTRDAGPFVASLGPALGFGARHSLSAAHNDLFTRVGVRHLLALSGLHVGLIAWLLRKPLGALANGLLALTTFGPRTRDLCSSMAGALLCWSFVELCGAAAPLRRAGWVLGLGVLARCVPPSPWNDSVGRRRADPWTLFCVALSFELWRHPLALSNVSVQLTYAATFAILWTAPGRARRSATDGAKLPVRWPLLRDARIHAKRTVFAAGHLSLAASLGTLPFLWARFGEWAPSGIVTTLWATPPLILLLPLVWLSALDPSAAIGVPWRAWTETLLELWVASLEWADRSPDTPVLLPEHSAWWIGALCVGGLLGLRRRRWLAVFGCSVLLGWAHRAPDADATFELWCLDAGHGTCVVWRGPDGEVWLSDAGSADRRHLWSAALAPLLARWNGAPVNAHLSHRDFDHRSSWERALGRLPGARRLGADLDVQGDLHQGRVAWTARPDLDYFVEQVRGVDAAGNAGSRGLLVRYGEHRLWLLSDADGPGLAATLELLEPGDLTLLLAPHHGAATAEVGALLDAVRPEQVWISGAHWPPIAAELDRRGLPWRWTARDGPLGLGLEPGRPARWLPAPEGPQEPPGRTGTRANPHSPPHGGNRFGGAP